MVQGVGMGDRGIVKWVVVSGYVMATSAAGAQTGGYPADPRAASKAPAYQHPPQSYPAGTSGYDQRLAAPTPPRPPAAPPQQGYTARPGYAQQQPRAQAYVLAPPLLPYYEGADPPAGYVL